MTEKQHPPFMWMSGELAPWERATVHASTLGWSTLASVFEGIKAYWNEEEGQLYGLMFPQHYARFAESMKLMRMRPRFSPQQLAEASVQLLRANECREDTYVFPLAYHGDATWFGTMEECSTTISIRTIPFKSKLGTGQPIKACVSSWTRLSDNVMSPRTKAISNYQNSRLALVEAQSRGFDQPILLNNQGKVAEGAASCVFMIRGGKAFTPPVTSGILESITRALVTRLLGESLEMPVLEREIDRTELYVAQEVFLCGTGAEITPVGSVDGYEVGAGGAGPLTLRLEALYHAIVRGKQARYRHLLSPVLATAPAAR